MRHSSNLSLNLPEGSDYYDVSTYNANFNTLDTLLVKNWGTYSILDTDWVDDTESSGYFKATLNVQGMSGNYYPSLIPVYTEPDAVDDERSALGKVLTIDTVTDQIVAYAKEKPESSFTFQLIGI